LETAAKIPFSTVSVPPAPEETKLEKTIREQVMFTCVHVDMPIHPWTTAEHSGPVSPLYQGSGTADQADLIKLGYTQLNLMSLHSTLVLATAYHQAQN